MAKLSRSLQKLFGSTASPGQIGVFGSLAAGSPDYSTDPETIQSLSNYLAGWYAAVVGENSPAIQDMNALFYLFAYQLCYLFQSGVPEWNAETTYYIGSTVNSAGVLYTSLVDNNLNNAVSDVSKWATFSQRTSVVTETANYVALPSDDFIRANGTITITLPAVASSILGKKYIIKNVSATGLVVTVAGHGSELIDGSNNWILNSSPQLESVSIINNGTSWDVI